VADSRDVALGRIRTALSDKPHPPQVRRDYERARPVGDVAALFAERVADYRAVVHRVREAELPARIEASLRARSARKMVAPADLPGWRLVERPGAHDAGDRPGRRLIVTAADVTEA